MHLLRKVFADYLLADAAPLSAGERWRSALAGLVGILLLEVLLSGLPLQTESHLLLAPAGASAVILYSLPHSPLGQPWAVIGGLGVSALVGLLCGHFIPWSWAAVAAAVGLSIWLMAALRCLHPPGGAMAIVMASVPQAGWGVSLSSVTWNICGLLLGALLMNNLLRERRYPQCAAAARWHQKPLPRARSGIEHEDLKYACERIDSYLDVSEGDLVTIYNLAVDNAFRRHATTRCADLMTQQVIAVERQTTMDEAWKILRQHELKSLPVINRQRNVIGLLSLEDFLQPGLIGATPGDGAIDEIMSRQFFTVMETDDISVVARLLVECHHPHAVPVLAADGRLAGIISQTDILAALYRLQALGQVIAASASCRGSA